jgi:predicted amidohydrolase
VPSAYRTSVRSLMVVTSSGTAASRPTIDMRAADARAVEENARADNEVVVGRRVARKATDLNMVA